MLSKSVAFCVIAGISVLLSAGGSAATTANERSYTFSEIAIKYFNEGNYRAAIIQLKNALQQDPRNPTAHILLGRSYLKLREGELAERELLRARRFGAHPDLILEPLGRAYLLQRKYKRIFEEIRPGYRGNQIEAKILALHGEAYLALQEWEKAEEAFSAASRLQPQAVFSLLGKARVLILKRQLDDAASLVDRSVKLEPNNADAWYERAEIFRIKQNNDAALNAYDKALELNPKHIRARLGRVTILVDIGRDESALEDIRSIRQSAPSETRAAYLESIILTRAGRANEAQAVLAEAENILKKIPPDVLRNDPPSLLLMGVVAFGQKHYEDASGYLTRYLELNPNHPGARKMLGWILLRNGNVWSAIEILRPAVKMTPDDPELLTLIANAHMRVKQYSVATEFLEKAVAIAPDKARVRTQLGLSRLAGGEEQEAIDDLETALSLAPDGSQPGQLLGLFYLKNRKFDEARAIAKSIAERDPLNPFAHNLAGAAELGKGNKAEARRQFLAALNISADYIPAYFNLAKLDRAEGNIEAARRRYHEVLEIRPKNIKAMRALADLSVAENDVEKAIKLLKEISVLDPNTVEHQVLLVDLYMRQNRKDEALNYARDLEIIHPTDVRVLHKLGRVLLATDKYQEAAERFRRMAEVVRQDPEPLRKVAILQEKARDFAGARQTLKKASSLDPDYLPVQIALIRLEERNSSIEKAIELATALQRQHPDFILGHIVAGDLFMGIKRYDDAVEAYAAAYAQERKVNVVQRLYDAKYRAGQEAEAYSLVVDWAKANPDDPLAKRLLASAHRRAGHVDKAIAINETLLIQNPEDPGLLNNLAGLYQIKGDRRARRFAERAYNLAPRHPIVLDTYGWILVTSGEAERGLALLRQAFTRIADRPEVRYHLAVALNRLGRDKEALDELKKALETGEPFEGMAEARALLRKLNDG